jgi:DNA modification methylase
VKPFFETELGKLYCGDVLDVLPSLDMAQMCVTSPPYWGLRDYGVDGQIGLEETPEEYVEKMVAVFREVRRVLRDDGTLWLNLGDSYAGNCSRASTGGRAGFGTPMLKPKDLVGVPWRVAFALQKDGWYLRSDIIWSKPNPIPESVTDRPTKAHEYVFLMSKSQRYYYDAEAIREPVKENSGQNMRAPKLGDHRKDGNYKTVTQKTYSEIKGANRRTVWTVATQPFSGWARTSRHFATFPVNLVIPCVKAGTKEGDVAMDPFMGSGTVAEVCERYGRRWAGIELSEKYCEIAAKRIEREASQLKLGI